MRFYIWYHKVFVAYSNLAADTFSKLNNGMLCGCPTGYANFAIANPLLKLVLFEGTEDGTINHLGFEVTTSDEVIAAEQRLIQAGLETTGIDDTVCCYAEKTETWLHGPDNTRWEWYVRTGDSEQMQNEIVGTDGPTICCAPEPAPAETSTASCS